MVLLTTGLCYSPIVVRAIDTKGLGRRFGRHWAVAHCDLEVSEGETLLIAGPNGSGKTTLLRLCATLLRPTRGHLRIFDHDPTSEPLACRRLLTLVGHDNYLYHQLTALETLRLWSQLSDFSGPNTDLQQLLEMVELGEWADTVVAGFSAGMKKRLTLLRARLEEPRLVLLDEPFSALDAAGQALVESWVGEFQAAGKTVAIASHNFAKAGPLCDRAVYIDQGQVVWSGPPAELESIHGSSA